MKITFILVRIFVILHMFFPPLPSAFSFSFTTLRQTVFVIRLLLDNHFAQSRAYLSQLARTSHRLTPS